MYLINTSFHVHTPIADTVVDAIRSEFIPLISSCGLFGNPLLVKILLDVDPDIRAYSLQMTANDLNAALEWLQGSASDFFTRLTARHGEAVLYFTTPMQVI